MTGAALCAAQRYNLVVFEISVEETFSSGHALRGYRGKCENPHGHNYRVRVNLAGPQLNDIGLLFDFKDLKAILRREIERLDHQYLNDIEPFREINPSAENLARHFFEQVAAGLQATAATVSVRSVVVFETDTTAATYAPAHPV